MPLIGEYEPSTYRVAREDAARYESDGGGIGRNGQPLVVLTTVGKTSGKLRKAPVIRVEHEGSYAVVASMGGAPKNPAWYHNAVNHPQVELQDGPVKYDMVAREVTGAEKSVWWERALAIWPAYAEYQTKTDRQIPVLVLEPLG